MRDVHKEIFNDSKKRQPGLKQRVLEALINAGKHGLSNAELKHIAIRFSALTNQLQLDGYDIELSNEGGGLVRYTLHNPKAIRGKVKVKSGIEKARDFFIERDNSVSFEQFTDFLNNENLHIKHKPNGIKK